MGGQKGVFWDPIFDPFLTPFLTPFWTHFWAQNPCYLGLDWLKRGSKNDPIFGPFWTPKMAIFDPKMAIFGPLFWPLLARSWSGGAPKCSISSPKMDPFWPVPQKRGQKRGPKMGHFGPQKWPFLTPFLTGPGQVLIRIYNHVRLKWPILARTLKKGVKKGVPKWVPGDPKKVHFWSKKGSNFGVKIGVIFGPKICQKTA